MKKPIKILFDAVPVAKEQLTGVGKTTEGLILALAKEYPEDIELVGHYFSFLGKNKGFTLPTAPNIRYRKTVLVPGKVFNLLRRMGVPVPYEFLTKERGDFHLFPGFLGWPSLFMTPSTTFFHDTTYLTHPQYVSTTNCNDLIKLMPSVVQRASFVITNSESSKQGLIEAYGTASEKILVEHIPPVDIVHISQKEAADRVRKLGIDGKFLLFFGTLEPRKNLVGLMHSYELLPESIRKQYSLVIAGGKGWKDEEILHTLATLKASGASVVQTGYVSDEDRAALYMSTSLYIMPSHYEGFGMQLLEGMSYGTPMLASDIPVLHEVGGDAAEYCGTSPEQIKEGIVKVLSGDSLREKMIAAGKERINEFSWNIVAKHVLTRIKENIR
jgi:alpha-1,3-rhamnosyl/mannosyltransferase